MANLNTKIEWCDATWNVITGCAKVSPGCAHCYAERVTERFSGKGSFEKIVLHPERLEQPLHWKKPRRIFVNSMSDLFHENVPYSFVSRAFAVMHLAKQHSFQVLTKRPRRMLEFFRSSDLEITASEGQKLEGERRDDVTMAAYQMTRGHDASQYLVRPEDWPLRNVWLGVSVENQHFADERVPMLLETPAAVRFISAEPLLSAIDISRWLEGGEEHGTPFSGAPTVGGCIGWTPPLDWVICGGESGPQARPMEIAWALALRDQCKAAAVPFFMKQLGGWPDKRGDTSQFPEDLRVREFPDTA